MPPTLSSRLHAKAARSLLHASFTAVLPALTILLSGCAVTTTRATNTALPAMATGNWQFTSSATPAVRLASLSGELSGNANAISGILHSQSASSCVTPGTAIEVSGSATSAGAVTLTGPVAGGTLTVTGNLATDGKSLTDAAYNVAGGTCAFAKPATATAQAYTPINGTYAGTFSDTDGPVVTVTAQLQQSDLSNTTGNFTMNGSGSFGQNPCFTSPVQVSGTQVTGGSFTMTYADSTTGNSVTASGTFSPDATTLTVTSWQLTGSCGPDTGVQSTMTKQ